MKASLSIGNAGSMNTTKLEDTPTELWSQLLSGEMDESPVTTTRNLYKNQKVLKLLSIKNQAGRRHTPYTGARGPSQHPKSQAQEPAEGLEQSAAGSNPGYS